MSTKSTIAWGEDFHLYREVFDEDHVYLRLDTTHFEAGYGRVRFRSQSTSGRRSGASAARGWTSDADEM